MSRLKREYAEIVRSIEEHAKRISLDNPESREALLRSRSHPDAIPFRVYPNESNFLSWHFTLLGPPESPYAEGLYHGFITFPPNYPFAPPDLQFLTPSGRFDTGRRICLTVTGYHPEEWLPAWGPRTMLMAIRSQFLTDDAGIGSIMDSDENRGEYAKK